MISTFIFLFSKLMFSFRLILGFVFSYDKIIIFYTSESRWCLWHVHKLSLSLIAVQCMLFHDTVHFIYIMVYICLQTMARHDFFMENLSNHWMEYFRILLSEFRSVPVNFSVAMIILNLIILVTSIITISTVSILHLIAVLQLKYFRHFHFIIQEHLISHFYSLSNKISIGKGDKI